MKRFVTYSAYIIILLIVHNTLYSQEKQTGVSISTDNYPPHPSAMLDVRSANKGILVSRVDQLPDASTINTTDGEGLLFYLTGPPDKKGFYYFKYIEDENKYGWVRLRYSQPRYPKGSIIMYSGDLTDDNGNLMFYNGSEALEQSNADDHFPYLGQGKEGTIMEGWQICNGHNRSPDMTDRFVVGVSDDENLHPDYTKYDKSEDAQDDEIDKPKHTWMMDENSMPRHNHKVNKQNFLNMTYRHRHKLENGSHKHTVLGIHKDGDRSGDSYLKVQNFRCHNNSRVVSSINIKDYVTIEESSENATFRIQGTVGKDENMPDNDDDDDANDQQAIENRPPYYTVIFLMRTDRGYPNVDNNNEQNYTEKKNPFPKTNENE